MTLYQILSVVEDTQPFIIEMVNQEILGVRRGNFISIKKFDERLAPHYDMEIHSISVDPYSKSLCIKV